MQVGCHSFTKRQEKQGLMVKEQIARGMDSQHFNFSCTSYLQVTKNNPCVKSTKNEAVPLTAVVQFPVSYLFI